METKTIIEKSMLERAKENESLILSKTFLETTADLMQEFTGEFALMFDIDYVGGCCDDYIQATVYVDNLIKDWYGYNIIFDMDIVTKFDTIEEFVETMMILQNRAKEIYNHFNSKD